MRRARRPATPTPEVEFDLAVDQVRATLRAASTPDERFDGLVALTLLLGQRYMVLRRAADIADAMRHAGDALGTAGRPEQESIAHLLLGDLLRLRFEGISHEVRDLDEAVSHLEQAQAIGPAEGDTQACVLGALALALGDLAQARADADPDAAAADAHAAVAAARAFYDAPSLSPDLRIAAAEALGNTLHTRYLVASDRADLDEALEVLREAADTLPKDDPRRSRLLYNAGGAVLQLNDPRRGVRDLEAAITANRVALEQLPDGHGDRPTVQAGLANQLLELSRSGPSVGRRAALDGAIRLADQAVRATKGVDRAAERAAHQHVLGQAFMDRGLATRSKRDLRRAVRDLRDSVEASPADSPRLAGRACSLAMAYGGLYDLTQRPRHRRTAVAAVRHAVAIDESDLHTQWYSGEVHHRIGDLDGAKRYYGRAVELLHLLGWAGLDVRSLQDQLRETPGIASDAAAALVDAGDPTGAVLALERGRAIILSRLLDVRTDRSQLAIEHPELCAQLDDVIAGLEGGDGPAAGEPQRRWELHRRFRDLVDEARSHEGFATFMGAPGPDLLRQAAVGGEVVVLNVSEHRCDALVLAPHRDDVRVVPLRDLTAADASDHARRFHHALTVVGQTGDPDQAEWAAARISATLAWLWRTVASPVLDLLGHDGEPGVDTAELPRLWWCPTGPLALLPLHAAGIHAHPDDLDWVGARVVSSSTLTLDALVRCRAPRTMDRDGGQEPRTLVVAPGDAAPVDGRPYPRVHSQEEELKEIKARITGRPTLLEGPNATCSGVLDALRSHKVLHFSCHARPVPDDPSVGFLALTDGPLRAHDLMGQLDDGVELCVLSACSTAWTAPDLVDEAFHLAAVFTFSGARRVVGTLWEAGDTTVPVVVREVYSALTAGQGPPDFDATARGLHRAVAYLRRQEHTAHPRNWASYAHFGA